MPRSSGCRRDVVFFGKKTIFILSNLSSKSSGWHGAFSMNRIMLLSSRLSLLLSLDRISIRISLFIHAFGWLKYSHGNSDLSWKPLKHLGFANLPMMIGFSFPTLALHSFFIYIRMLFFRPRLNILIFLPILGRKYSCIILKL